MADTNDYKQVGWWIPGSLKPGWNANYQANFGDMSNKFNQLGLDPLVKGILPNEGLGFYFSMAEFDYIQLLTIDPPEGTENTSDVHFKGLASYSIVSYSVWMANQEWSSFSPIPILRLQGITQETIKTSKNEKGIFNVNPWPKVNPKQTYFPTGWYFTGSFSQKWYEDTKANYIKALEKRKELNIGNLSPLYFCQSSFYDCIQMAQAPYNSDGIPDVGVIQEYVSWFNAQGFGSLKSIPFMSEDLLSEAIEIGGKTP